MKRTPMAALLACCCLGFSGRADIVQQAFSAGDFVPHVYTEKRLVQRYGVGTVSNTSVGMERAYRSKDCAAWLVAQVETDASPAFRVVQALTVTSIPLPQASFQYSGDICSISLAGVSLGDNQDLVLAMFRGRWTKRAVQFAGRKVEEVRVTPDAGETDLYYKYYLSGAEVVGMELGVTE